VTGNRYPLCHAKTADDEGRPGGPWSVRTDGASCHVGDDRRRWADGAMGAGSRSTPAGGPSGC